MVAVQCLKCMWQGRPPLGGCLLRGARCQTARKGVQVTKVAKLLGLNTLVPDKDRMPLP